MSYILDALKRADAERERGAVPGLHAQQTAALAAAPTTRVRTRLWLIGGAVLTLSAIAAGLWQWRASTNEASLPAVQLAVVAPLVNTSAAPAAAPAPMPAPAPASTVAPAPVVASPLPVVAPVAVGPAPQVVAAPVHAATPKAAVSAPAAAPVVAPVIPLLSEMPEDFRHQIPALTITGAVYSETPAQRLLLVNNLVLNQGGLAAPEVSLEEIRPKSSVFSFRGTRFRLAH